MQNAIETLERTLKDIDSAQKDAEETRRHLVKALDDKRAEIAHRVYRRDETQQALDLLRAVQGVTKPSPEKAAQYTRLGQALGKMENPFTREAMDQAGTLRQGAQKHYTGSQDWLVDGAAKVEDPSYNRDSEGSLRRGY